MSRSAMRCRRRSRRSATTGFPGRRTPMGPATSAPNLAQSPQTERTEPSIDTVRVRGVSLPHSSQIKETSPLSLNKSYRIYSLRASELQRDSMDDDQIREFHEKLSERIAVLEERNDKLLESSKRVEGEKRFIETELLRLQKEIKRLKTELDRLKAPPLIIGSIRDILADGRVVVKSSTGPDFIVNTAEYVAKENIEVGARVALNKQTLAVMGVLPPSLDPIVMGAEIIDKPTVAYEDVGGLRDQIRDIKEAVEDPLLKPELYRRVGIEPPKGVLLVGPPGTGKTLLAKAVANRTNARFIRFVGSELVQKYIGEGARLVRELFQMAREKGPSIVFIDELDSIGAKRLDRDVRGPGGPADAHAAPRGTRWLQSPRGSEDHRRDESARHPRRSPAPPRPLRPDHRDPDPQPGGPHDDLQDPYAEDERRAGRRLRRPRGALRRHDRGRHPCDVHGSRDVRDPRGARGRNDGGLRSRGRQGARREPDPIDRRLRRDVRVSSRRVRIIPK